MAVFNIGVEQDFFIGNYLNSKNVSVGDHKIFSIASNSDISHVLPSSMNISRGYSLLPSASLTLNSSYCESILSITLEKFAELDLSMMKGLRNIGYLEVKDSCRILLPVGFVSIDSYVNVGKNVLKIVAADGDAVITIAETGEEELKILKTIKYKVKLPDF